MRRSPNTIGIALLGIAFALMFGCKAKTSDADDISDLEPIPMQCTDPRPELCTQDYRPVCATRDTGIRCATAPCPASEWKTYSNECSACSDPEVMQWVAGACEDAEAQ